MKGDTVTLRATRAVMVYGRRIERGGKVELPPVAAIDAVEGSVALEFANPDDRQRCAEARRAELARDLRRVPGDALGGPWMPARY